MNKITFLALAIFGLLALMLVFDIRQHVISIDTKLNSMSDSISTMNEKASKSLLLKM